MNTNPNFHSYTNWAHSPNENLFFSCTHYFHSPNNCPFRPNYFPQINTDYIPFIPQVIPKKPKRNKSHPDKVNILSTVNEIFASEGVNQSFVNELKKPIELYVTFPLNQKLTLMNFVVSIDDKIIISKVMSKEKAE